MFSLGTRIPEGDRRALSKDLKGCPTEKQQDLFSSIHESWTGNNGLKLQ